MNILLVDDDLFLLNAMVEEIDWKSLPVERVFSANNGFQAQEILKNHDISLIITDIEMPGMSGLELIRWTQEQQMDCKCIFLSGHASFSYAQEAINLQSSQYLLKPVSNEELYHSAARVIGTIRKKNKEVAADVVLRKQNFWVEYVEKYRQGQLNQNLENRANELYGELTGFFVMLILEPDVDNGAENNNADVTGYRLADMAKEAWCGRDAGCETAIFWHRKQWALIGRTKAEEVERLAELFADALCRENPDAKVFYHEGHGKAMAECMVELDRLSDVALKAITENGAGVNVSRWNLRRDPELEPFYSAWKKELREAEKLGALGLQIAECVERECGEARVTRDVFVRLRMILFRMLFAWLEQQKLQQSMFLDEEEFKEKYERSVDCLTNMKAFITWIFSRMEGYRYSDSPRSSIVRKIKKYVDEHLAEDMSRKEIANLICLSENYVSTIFSEETGESLPGYIARMRMEKAKEYLRNTDWVVSRISVEVGYTNFSYFSKVFKEHVGKTPNEYRRG